MQKASLGELWSPVPRASGGFTSPPPHDPICPASIFMATRSGAPGQCWSPPRCPGRWKALPYWTPTGNPTVLWPFTGVSRGCPNLLGPQAQV